ncbi:MAG: biotin--[acetyl-CoA-carboxylase] ligase [Desulfovibrio sp.]|nr:biotin--[acetyl-CoA-carboxylase] ligase [Desulfovibrio sp.]
MTRHFRILDSALDGLAQPATLAGPGAAHPLWAADLEALGAVPELGAARHCRDIVLCGPCASTMDVARRLVEEGVLAPFGSVITPEQTAGRGQLRRAWLSRPGNVLATLVCPPADGLWNDLRPLVLGYLFAEALSALGQAVQVKWPNDLLSGGRKVAGILVEERKDCVLAGIGVNLGWAPPAEALREGHCVDAGEFVPSDGAVGPVRLWGALVNHVETGYRTLLEAFSPTEFLTIFRSRMAWQGRRVLVREGESVRYEAVVRGISAEGGLLLDRAGREVVLLAGDVIPV